MLHKHAELNPHLVEPTSYWIIHWTEDHVQYHHLSTAAKLNIENLKHTSSFPWLHKM